MAHLSRRSVGYAFALCLVPLACGEVKESGLTVSQVGGGDAAADAAGSAAGSGGESGGAGGDSTGGVAGSSGGAPTASGGTSTASGGTTGSTGGATGSTGGAPAASGGSTGTGGATSADPPDAAIGDGGGDAGAPVACKSDGDCSAPSRFCDTAASICVDCLSNNHCPQGLTCAKDHVCRLTCATSADCSDPKPYCDPGHHECVQCLTDTNCSSGSKNVCNPDTLSCVDCLVDDDCSCLLPGQAPCCTSNHSCVCGLLVCF